MAENIDLGIVGIKNKGEYDSQTSYEKLNVVTYQGSTYCALKDTLGNLPTNTEYWQLYAEKGGVGPQGPKPVKGVDYYTDTDKEEIEQDLASDIQDAVHDEVIIQVGNISDGTPLLANSMSDMTDTTRLYVLITDGYVYYYDGTSWVQGWIYQAAEDSDTLEKTSEDSERLKRNSYLIQDYSVDEITGNVGYNYEEFCFELDEENHSNIVIQAQGFSENAAQCRIGIFGSNIIGNHYNVNSTQIRAVSRVDSFVNGKIDINLKVEESINYKYLWVVFCSYYGAGYSGAIKHEYKNLICFVDEFNLNKLKVAKCYYGNNFNSYRSYNGYAKVDELVSVESNMKNYVDNRFDEIVEITEPTIFDISYFTESGYWGVDANNVAALVELANTISPPLIPVNPGDRVELSHWSKNDLLGAILFSCYDLDQKPFNGNHYRINGNDSRVNYDQTNGLVSFIVPDNCNLLGIRFKTTTNYDGVPTVKIGERTIDFTDNLKESIENIINESNIEEDLTAELYQKGASPKSYNTSKSLGILSAGQSNADGRAPMSDLSIPVTFPINNLHYSKNKLDGTFNQFNRPSSIFAYDMITYNQLCNIDNLEVYAIKWSEGGTSIDKTVRNHVWSPFYEDLPDTKHSLLVDFETQIRNAIRDNGQNFEIRAFIWHQGESDGSSQQVASRYYKNLKYFVSYVRGIIGNNRLPFICGSLPDASQVVARETINDAFFRLAEEDPYFYCVDLSPCTLLDNYHLDAKSAEYFGLKVYDCLIDAGVISGTKINPIFDNN